MYTYHRCTPTRLDKDSSGSSYICKSPAKCQKSMIWKYFMDFQSLLQKNISDNHQVCQAGHTRYGSCHHPRAQIARQSCGDAAEMCY